MSKIREHFVDSSADRAEVRAETEIDAGLVDAKLGAGSCCLTLKKTKGHRRIIANAQLTGV